MYTLKMGASSAGRDYSLTKKDFIAYKNAGIEYMEFSSNADVYENADWQEIKRASEQTGVKVWSVHAPFRSKDDNISNPDEKMRLKAIETYTEVFKNAAFIGAKIVIVHPSSEPISDEERPAYISRSKESLKVLAERAAQYGITIAVEDLPRTCLGNTAEELGDIISVDERIRICFDVNHLLKQTHKHFIEVIGDKIATLHISDYDFVDERHQLPGNGKIDWKELLDLLESINYSGPFMYEVRMANTAQEVLPGTRYAGTLADGKANFDKVMERKI